MKNHCTFIRLLSSTRKDIDLLNAVNEVRDQRLSDNIYTADPKSFNAIDGAPFAYWTDPRLLDSFSSLDQFLEVSKGRDVRCGLSTLDTFRFIRAATEVPLHTSDWNTYISGGIYSPMFDEHPSAVLWGCSGREVKQYVEQKVGSASRNVRSESFYYRPGFVFPRRTRGFSPRALPAKAIFSAAGQAGFTSEDDLEWTIMLMSTIPIGYLISLSQGASAKGGGSSPQFEVGLVKRVPWPTPTHDQKENLSRLFREVYDKKRSISSTDETSNWFLVPPATYAGEAHTNSQDSFTQRFHSIVKEVRALRDESNNIACRIFGLPDTAWRNLLSELTDEPSGPDAADYLGDGLLDDDSWTSNQFHGETVVSYQLGCVFGRWDIRYATGERQPPELPDPFDPLPVCPPGMLQNADGLPATPSDVPDDYPLPITWPGILVSDPGHPQDIVARVRDALAVIWGDRSAAIEQEACEILGVRILRDYFAEKKSGGKFFKDHLKRYSKSRRQAPIYWPLSTESGTYTLWIYYHRLNEDTLWSCITRFVAPKQEEAEQTLARLAAKGDARTKAEDKEYEESAALIGELATFRAELERLAKIWKPNLNDGVQITAAPLWSLFRLKAWQTKLKATWKSLEKGEYDWAHLAHTLWPARVIKKCAKDRSLAIAHGYEKQLWIEIIDERGKSTWQPRSNAEEIVEELVGEIS